MSSLPDRRDSPRRRIEGSRMHPGWAVFMLGWFSGMMTTCAIVYAAIHMDWGFAFYAALATVAFWAGGRRAEKLTDRR